MIAFIAFNINVDKTQESDSNGQKQAIFYKGDKNMKTERRRKNTSTHLNDV